LEIELACLGDRGAQVLDAERVAGAVAVRQAVAVDLRPAAIPEVAFETGHAVTVCDALGDSRDVTSTVGQLTVASDRAISVGEADPKIIKDTTVCPRIAECVYGTIKVALTGDLDLSLYRPRSVDGAAGEEQEGRKKRHRA
jgi:hypothetical protein